MTMKFVSLWDIGRSAPPGWASHLPVIWDEIEPKPGRWNFGPLKSWIEARLDPVHLGLVFYMDDLKDRSPGFLHRPHAIKAADGREGELPPYEDTGWRRGLWEAIQATADTFKDHPLVASFWCPLGMNQETCPTHPDFATSVREFMPGPDAYYAFIWQTVQVALEAWKPKPVYIEAAPGPGELWGQSGRQLIADALNLGARYKMNGLLADQADSFGYGSLSCLAKLDIGRYAPGVAFEFPDHGTGKSSGEALWRLLRCLHWKADFLAVQLSWQPRVLEAIERLPTSDWWIVFRDAEYPLTKWDDSGLSGEPGPWHGNITVARLEREVRFNGNSWGWDRWISRVSNCELVLEGWPKGCPARIAGFRGTQEIPEFVVPVADGRLTLPPGEYSFLQLFPTSETSNESLLTRVKNLEVACSGLSVWLTELDKRLSRLESWRGDIASVSRS